jgi:hypothetical protein
MTGAAFIGCPWCNLRTQGCRCVTPCGAPQCDAEHQPLPAVVGDQERR